jgi:hypothetical protein
MRTQKQITVIPESGVEVILEGVLTRIYFDFRDPDPVNEEPVPADIKVCESIDVDSRNYDRIVAAIVTDHYSSDAYQALIANYQMAKDPEAEISEEKRSEYIQEYEAFQAWRAHAKEVAHIVVAEIESM